MNKLVVENLSDFVVQLTHTCHKQLFPPVDLSHKGSRIHILFKNVPLQHRRKDFYCRCIVIPTKMLVCFRALVDRTPACFRVRTISLFSLVPDLPAESNFQLSTCKWHTFTQEDMWQRKDFLLITSFRNHYQNNVTFQPLNSIVSVYRGLGSAYSPSASLRHIMIGQKKEFLPRDWEQTSIGPSKKKKFILTSTQIIEFIETIGGFRMVRQSFWQDSKSGPLRSFVSSVSFSRRAFLSLLHVSESPMLHAKFFFNLLTIFF